MADNWWKKTLSVLGDWLVVGPDPKVRDPENSARLGAVAAGVQVTDASAMRLSAFFACVRLIASTIGSLPVTVFETSASGERVPARSSPLYRVLHDSPNADQTPVDYFEFLVISMLLRGDHFARKLTEGGRLIGLEPINPANVTVRRKADGRLAYRWRDQGTSYDLDEDEVFHVRGFGGGPIRGLSIIAYAAESLGIAIAADRAAGGMFGNGVRAGGILSTEQKLDRGQQETLESLLHEKYVGAAKAGVPMVLGHGVKWEQITLKADEAQLLESRGWSVEEICRWFGVPPFMIGHNEKTTSWGTGIEQMLLGFQKFTLNPYLRRIEQAMRQQLLTPAERARGMIAEFNLEGLLRADSKGRADFYRQMTQIGAMTVNEVRRLENLPPIEGGDVARVQSQNVPLTDSQMAPAL